MLCTTDICNSAVGLNTALLQISFFWQGNLWKNWSEIVRFFVGYPKICLFNCFADTCFSHETPKRSILFFGSPGSYDLLSCAYLLMTVSVWLLWVMVYVYDAELGGVKCALRLHIILGTIRRTSEKNSTKYKLSIIVMVQQKS